MEKKHVLAAAMALGLGAVAPADARPHAPGAAPVASGAEGGLGGESLPDARRGQRQVVDDDRRSRRDDRRRGREGGEGAEGGEGRNGYEGGEGGEGAEGRRGREGGEGGEGGEGRRPQPYYR